VGASDMYHSREAQGVMTHLPVYIEPGGHGKTLQEHLGNQIRHLTGRQVSSVPTYEEIYQ